MYAHERQHPSPGNVTDWYFYRLVTVNDPLRFVSCNPNTLKAKSESANTPTRSGLCSLKKLKQTNVATQEVFEKCPLGLEVFRKSSPLSRKFRFKLRFI